MENLLKKIKINSAIGALLCILTGVIFIVFRQPVADLLARVIGILLLVAGVLFVITYIAKREKTAFELSGLILGVIMAVFGIVVLTHPLRFEMFLAMILGIVILVSGIESMINSFALMRRGDPRWWVWLILSLITVIMGLILVIRRDQVTATLIMLCGIFFVYDGVTSLIVTGRLAHLEKVVRQGLKDLSAIDAEAIVREEGK